MERSWKTGFAADGAGAGAALRPGALGVVPVIGGLHGANRLGGNGVGDIVVNGKIAGRNAATEGL